MDFDERVYQIALSLLPGIGPVTAKKLLDHCGSASEIFRQKKKALMRIPRVGEGIASSLKNGEIFKLAEKELTEAVKKNRELIFFLDKAYPQRLKQCYDSPILLYYEGCANLNHRRMVAVVGTRRITHYGEQITENLIETLAPYNVIILSGLAYGVDAMAHKAALKYEVPTIGVLGHGLDKMYPAAHRKLASKMIESGALLTDYPAATKPDRENFPQRNRIVAGLCDALVVIESGESGGSMITAEFANNYNRDVFAFPGKAGDEFSAGCNKLIKQHKAAIIESGEDLAQFMRWEKTESSKQSNLILPADANEEKMVWALRENGKLHEDELASLMQFNKKDLSSLLIRMEFSGQIKALAGKFYALQ
jgi:DNA processing protein